MKRLDNNLNNIQDVALITSLADVNTDLITMNIGKFLGKGTYRTVYEYNMDSRYVIKIEPDNTSCNLMEYTLWDEIQGLTGKLVWVKDWFAPVHYCSPNGKILIMERTIQNYSRTRPNVVPNFFTDVKSNNFGWLGKNFVCHDYGFIWRFIKYEKKFQKIEW